MADAIIVSNGSKWASQEPDTLETLEDRLKTYELEDWSYTKTNKNGGVEFFGNFKRLSHVFDVIIYDQKQVTKFRRMFYKNRNANLA